MAGSTGAAPYAFDNLLDSASELDVISGVGLNEAGAMVIYASLDAGGEGLFAFDGTSLQTIADTLGEFSSLSTHLKVNSSGAVAFLANYDAGPLGRQTLFVGNGSTITPIVDTAGPFKQLSFPSINDNGDIAFMGQLDSGEYGVFRVSNGVTAKLAGENGQFDSISMQYWHNTPSINNAGEVAFQGWLDDGTRGIYKSDGVAIQTVVDTHDGYSAYTWLPHLREDGSVFFGASPVSGPNGLFLHAGDVTSTIAVDNQIAFGLDSGFMNADGDAAFLATFLFQDGAVDVGIMTGDDVANDLVIRDGDSLFGSVVTDVKLHHGLVSGGRIAFTYTLDNGQTGVAIATPLNVPEPSSKLILATFVGAMIGTAFRRKK